ncbi:MAG: hypothetical protein ACREVA_09595 [Burkholderiales bacterium]
MLVVPDDALKEPSDAWNLEEIDMRLLVFDFFINPTEKERRLHETQKKKLAKRFEGLGWQ